MTAFEDFIYLSPWAEVIGRVIDLREHNNFVLALVGEIVVALPHEFGESMRESVGKKIGILHTDTDFRLRVLDNQE